MLDRLQIPSKIMDVDSLEEKERIARLCGAFATTKGQWKCLVGVRSTDVKSIIAVLQNKVLTLWVPTVPRLFDEQAVVSSVDVNYFHPLPRLVC